MGSIASPAIMGVVVRPQQACCCDFDSSGDWKERLNDKGRRSPNMRLPNTTDQRLPASLVRPNRS